MKEKDKNNKSSLSEFQRYIRGEMTKREENAFQRKLQRDPFAEEAAEGLSEISAEEAVSDLESLEKRLKTRVSRKPRFIYYRIAASIAVLMIISSVFIIIKNKSAGELSEANAVQVQLEIPESKGINKPKDAVLQDRISVAEKRASESAASTAAPDVMAETLPERQKSDAAEEPVNVAQIAAKESELFMAEDQVAVPAAASSKMIVDAKELNENLIRPDTALEEVVVVGYGTTQKSDNEATDYSPPTPAEGKAAFEKYIRENIRKPGILKEGERAVVVISFIVQSNGIIDSIKIIRSPGLPFSDEAMRLIKEGPGWKPAIENGKTINDEVKIRIVFYKNNDYEHLPE